MAKFHFTLLLVILFIRNGEGRGLSTREEEQLKILNKPATKSIQDENGDVFDCIDIYKQPAFDNPLLKGHKIQMRPTSLRKKSIIEKSSQHEQTLGGLGCPDGTVPIRRTTKEDLIRAKSFQISQSTGLHPLYSGNPKDYMAILQSTMDAGTTFHGAEATMNIIGLKLPIGQTSKGCIVIQGEGANATTSTQDVNLIQAGWVVMPHFFGDSRTRFFGHWRGAQSGCINLRCPGFVQINNEVGLGLAFPNTSIYNDTQVEMTILIHQDPSTKNWWLSLPKASKDVGYWPGSLFSNLKDKAFTVAFGGFVEGFEDIGIPPMGYGTFPQHYYLRSGYFAEMQIIDKDNHKTGLDGPWAEFASNPKCYGAKYYGEDGVNGYAMEYGGPGGKCGN